MDIRSAAAVDVSLTVGDELDSDNHLAVSLRRERDDRVILSFLDADGRAMLRKHLESFMTEPPFTATVWQLNAVGDLQSEVARLTQLNRQLQSEIGTLQSEVGDLQRLNDRSVLKEVIESELKELGEYHDDSKVDSVFEQLAASLGLSYTAEVEFDVVVSLQVTVRGTRKRSLPEESDLDSLAFDVVVTDNNGYTSKFEDLNVISTEFTEVVDITEA